MADSRFGARWPRSGAVDAGGQRLEVHVFAQADQRVADLGTPIFAFMFGKQADPGLHHRWYSLVVADVAILPSQANCRQVFRGRLNSPAAPAVARKRQPWLLRDLCNNA